MSTYPEIDQLQAYFNGRKISFRKLEEEKPYFFLIEFSIDKKSWKIYVDDEYHDFDLDKPLACLYLTLLALDTYDYSDDYLNWCNQYGLDSSDLKWLDYFKTLDSIYQEVKTTLGKIDPCISDFDYTLRTGVVDELVKPIN